MGLDPNLYAVHYKNNEVSAAVSNSLVFFWKSALRGEKTPNFYFGITPDFFKKKMTPLTCLLHSAQIFIRLLAHTCTHIRRLTYPHTPAINPRTHVNSDICTHVHAQAHVRTPRCARPLTDKSTHRYQRAYGRTRTHPRTHLNAPARPPPIITVNPSTFPAAGAVPADPGAAAGGGAEGARGHPLLLRPPVRASFGVTHTLDSKKAHQKPHRALKFVWCPFWEGVAPPPPQKNTSKQRGEK